jgi:hypothetical protein
MVLTTKVIADSILELGKGFRRSTATSIGWVRRQLSEVLTVGYVVTHRIIRQDPIFLGCWLS